MDYTVFAADRGTISYPERSGRQQEVLEQADAWTVFFEHVISARLNTATDEPLGSLDEITNTLHRYEDWCNGPLETLKQSLFQHNSERSKYLANYLNFHFMSDLFVQQWFRLMTSAEWDAKDTKQYNGETQDYLALMSVELQKRRETALKQQGKGSIDAINGILSEYDAAIAALHLMKSHPELILIPAPGTFERSHANPQRNADFLIFDTTKREIIGMQVKTFVDEESYTKYDKDYVFLVDSAIDLGDVLSKKVPLRTKPIIANQPGLLAAHHVRNWPKQMNLRSHPWLAQYIDDERTLMGLKFYANMLTQGTKDVSQIARQRVGERVITHLYRTPSFLAREATETDMANA